MPIPDFQTLMLPLLRFAEDGAEHVIRDAFDTLAKEFLLPSGRQAIFHNRVGWANFYLKKSRLLESPRRGIIQITERGMEVLRNDPVKIDIRFLEQYPEFLEFRGGARPSNDFQPSQIINSPNAQTPEELLELSIQNLRLDLAQELLNRTQSCSPSFFERLVIELLVKMGYGGSRRDASEQTKISGDGGIDGIIKEDRLGLDTIYLQAKRWQGTVGRPEVQKFVGALQGLRAKKGVFITTSNYTQEAIQYVSLIDIKVVLIDGKQLAELMIDFDVGVSLAASYSVKRIDSDYFEDG
jgi:restriction system protein